MDATHRFSKLALVVGCLALAAGVWAAHRTPATGYELSIYAATPTATWAGVGAAVALGALAAFAAPRDSRSHDLGLLLVGGGALAVFSVPILRGYAFYGGGDSLTHLGWAKEIATDRLEPTRLLYPGIHSLAVFAAEATGGSLKLAMLHVVLVAFPVVFLLFVPLTVQLLGGGRRALAIGALAAALFAPINNISVHPVAHPTSQAILFAAFLFYLFLAYTVAPAAGREPTPVRDSPLRADGGPPIMGATATGVLLAVCSAAVVLVHPQQALNVAVAFAAVAALQLAYRRWGTGHPIAYHRPVFAQTAVVLGAFAAWAPRFERVSGAVTATVQSILRQGATAGNVVSQKGSSLVEVGGSLPTLFAKLFLPALVLSLLAAALVLGVMWRGTSGSNANALVYYLAAALVPLFGAFCVMLAAQVGDQYFRYQGFMLLPGTVLGAVALARLQRAIDAGRGRQVGSVVAAVALLALAPAGALALHPAPYTYQPNSQVTATDFSGYSATFETRETEVPFVGVRGGPRRFVDSHYGTEYVTEELDFPGERASVGEAVFARGNYSTAFEADHYFAVSRSTYLREVALYDGFRYPASGFAALDATAGVHRVRSSDGFTLYRIRGED